MIFGRILLSLEYWALGIFLQHSRGIKTGFLEIEFFGKYFPANVVKHCSAWSLSSRSKVSQMKFSLPVLRTFILKRLRGKYCCCMENFPLETIWAFKALRKHFSLSKSPRIFRINFCINSQFQCIYFRIFLFEDYFSVTIFLGGNVHWRQKCFCSVSKPSKNIFISVDFGLISAFFINGL